MWDLACNCISNLDPSLLRFPVLNLTSNHAWPAELWQVSLTFFYLLFALLGTLLLRTV